jgi:hypothetical protein
MGTLDFCLICARCPCRRHVPSNCQDQDPAILTGPDLGGGSYFFPIFFVPREMGGTSDLNLYFGCTEFETAGHRSSRCRCDPP